MNMRGDRNFKGSDSRDPSVYFLFCDRVLNDIISVNTFFITKSEERFWSYGSAILSRVTIKFIFFHQILQLILILQVYENITQTTNIKFLNNSLEFLGVFQHMMDRVYRRNFLFAV